MGPHGEAAALAEALLIHGVLGGLFVTHGGDPEIFHDCPTDGKGVEPVDDHVIPALRSDSGDLEAWPIRLAPAAGKAAHLNSVSLTQRRTHLSSSSKITPCGPSNWAAGKVGQASAGPTVRGVHAQAELSPP